MALARCNLEAGQRWVRQHLVSAGGLDYWQLRNLSSGRCLTAAGGTAAATLAAGRARGWTDARPPRTGASSSRS